jgi:hypothetical protein
MQGNGEEMVRRKLKVKVCSMQIRERQERRKRYKRQGKKRASCEGRRKARNGEKK